MFKFKFWRGPLPVGNFRVINRLIYKKSRIDSAEQAKLTKSFIYITTLSCACCWSGTGESGLLTSEGFAKGCSTAKKDFNDFWIFMVKVPNANTKSKLHQRSASKQWTVTSWSELATDKLRIETWNNRIAYTTQYRQTIVRRDSIRRNSQLCQLLSSALCH